MSDMVTGVLGFFIIYTLLSPSFQTEPDLFQGASRCRFPAAKPSSVQSPQSQCATA